MPNPGTFRGTRLTFLDAQADAYANGVRNNQLSDTVADIQRRYFKRYPMSLAHNVEPTQEWLDSVDDSAPDAEAQAPDLEIMSNEAYSEALEKFNSLQAETKARKDSIKRRLAYVYSKNCGKDASFDSKSKKGATDPLTALKAKLAGVELKTPRMRTAYNVWGPQNRAVVDPVYNRRVQDGNVLAKEQLALRSSIYKELFEELPDEEQKKWSDIAKRDHERALEDLRAQERATAVRSNADYQRVISALPSIMQPVLDLLCEYTGWKFSLQGGGPEPADGGRLNMIFMHSGVAPGSVSVDFGSAERETFKKLLMPAFGRYMKKCYNKEACIARALPANHGTATLADVRFEEGTDVGLYRVEYDKSTTKSAPKKRLFEQELEMLNKGKGKAKPPTGTPSPMVRFGPPIGKPKNRMLPTKDNPASLVPGSSKVFKSSPLAQTVITAQDTAPRANSSPLLGSPESQLTGSSLPAPPIRPPTPTLLDAAPTGLTDAAASSHGVDSTHPPNSTQPAAHASTPAELSLQPEFALPVPTAGSAAPDDDRTKIPSPSMRADSDVDGTSKSLTSANRDSPRPSNAPDTAGLSPGSDGAPSPPPSPAPSRATSPAQSHLPELPRSPERVPLRNTMPAPLPPTSAASPGPKVPVPSYPALPMPSCPTSPAPLGSTSPTLLRPTSLAPSCHGSPTPSRPVSPTPSRPVSPVLLLPTSPSLPHPTSPVTPHPTSPVTPHPTSPVPSHPTSPVPSHPASPVPARRISPVPARRVSPVPLRRVSPAPLRRVSPISSHPASPAPSRRASPVPSDHASPIPSPIPSRRTSSAPLCPTSPRFAPTRTLSPVPSHSKSQIGSAASLTRSPPLPVPAALPYSSPTTTSDPTLPPPLDLAPPAPPHSAPPAIPRPTLSAQSDVIPPAPSHPISKMQSPPEATLAPASRSMPPILRSSTPPAPPAPHPTRSHAVPEQNPRPSQAVPPTSRAAHVSLEGVIAALQTTSLSATPPGAATVPSFEDPVAMQVSAAETTSKTARGSSKRSSSKPMGAQPSKKQRTGASFARAFAVPAAANSPKWMGNAVDFLAGEDLGSTWRRAVGLWASFEAGNGFDEQGTKLLARGRPPVVAEWIKRARSPKYRPTIGDLTTFENAFTLWWRAVQPGWRLSEGNTLLSRADGDWDTIRCHGVNGLLSALAALFFWGLALEDRQASDIAWNAAVDDVIYVLEGLV